MICTSSLTVRLSVSQLRRMMLYDGIGYLIVLTAANVLNALLFLGREDVQTAGASLGYCVTWIMTQRLLIHLYDASREHREEEDLELAGAALTLSKNVTGHRNISRVVRSQFDKNQTDPFDLGGGPRDSTSTSEYPEDLNVSVRIERTVKSKRVSRTLELEDYSRRSRM
ncbi:hypothetical protein CPB83DRAFT_313968 [Crepidotus variabilis]|uniref:Uncharacterized protein n=1 Tax=Crepidotus variabilis TaxID=179855 RepID=A0A9P6JPT4_9AGAR|nr:hypothetical protein CPB83DRAFT_313968 [Crepidotus variabilis]